MTKPRSKARIEARIKQRVAYCLEFEVNDPRSTFLTVTRVEISDDLSMAKIYYTVLGGAPERSRTVHMLEDATGFVRRQLGRVLQTRRIPRIAWFYDDAVEEAARVEEAIAKALAKDKNVNPRAHQDRELAEAVQRRVDPELELPDDEAELEREVEEFLTEREEGEAEP